MDDALSGTIRKVFSEVLERQAFMFADPAGPEDFRTAKEGFLAASMGFQGQAEGRLTLAVSRSLAPEIASNFLGMEASDPFVAARSRDACKELLNVTCGHVLTALYGEEPIFDLSIPEVAEMAPDAVLAWSRKPGALRFTAEGKPLLLTFAFGGAAAGPSPMGRAG